MYKNYNPLGVEKFYYKYEVYISGKCYAHASSELTMMETVRFFDKIGTFKNQWINVWNLLGF